MKSVALGILLTLASSVGMAADGQWLTDLAKAQEQAKKEKKMVLVDFTGSDWCPPCQALQKNVFSSKEFKDYAKDNLVLVEVDFPRRKPQSQAVKTANQELARKHEVDSFPTVIVFDSTGKELSKEAGYDPKTTAAQYVAKLKKLKKA